MRALHEVTAGVRDASRQIEAEGGNIDRVISMVKKGLATLGIGIGFKEIVSQVSNTRDQFQKLEIAFGTFLGSAEKADALMSQLIHTAAVTPFEMSEVANGAKMLLAYGVAAEDVNSTLIKLGDLSAGLGQSLSDIMYLYGTTISKPKMDTEDLMQFMGRGIPMAKALAEQFGVAESKVRELVSAGKIGRDEVIKAIDSLTGEGSMFGGLMEAQSASIGGQISNIQDAIEQMFNEIGKSTEGVIDLTLGATASIVENWQTVLLILGDIALAYGADKAILAGASAVATSAYGAELTALSSLLPVKQESINLDIQEALAKGKITEATASKVIAMRKEVATYMDSLAATKASAAAEAQAAAQKYRSALKQSLAAKAALEAKRQELVASGEICGAYISENAIKEMGIATDKAKAASIQATSAKQEYHAAVTKKKIATEALETATTNANTVSQNLNARSTNILTVAKEALTKSTKKLYSTMTAHPYALIAAAAAALGYGIYKLVTYQTDYEKSISRLDDALVKKEQSLAKDNIEIERHFGKLKSAKKGTKEWEEARNSIWSKYGRYLKSLGDEKTALNDVAKAYTLVKEEAEKAARARTMESFIQSEGESHANKMGDYRYQALRMVEKRYGKEFAAKHENDIIALVEGKATANKEFLMNMNTKDGFFGRAGNFTRLLAQAQKERENYDKILKEAEERFEMSSSSQKEKNSEGETDVQNKSYWEAKKKDAVTRLETLTYIAAAGKEGDKIRQEISEYNKRLESFNDGSKNKPGPTAAQLVAKEENAAGKLADILRKQAEERLRIEQDYEYERWQSRINLMQEGEAKVLAQQNLDFDKEKTNLQRRLADDLEAELSRQMAVFDAEQNMLAAADKKYAKKTFRDSDIDQSAMDAVKARYVALQEDLTKAQQKADADRLQSAKESFNAYLQEFGTYQQKREAIATDYDTRIAAAANAGDRMMLEAQKTKALSDLDYQQWIDSGEIALAFGDISNLSQQTVSRLIEDMEKYREKVVATFDPEKIEKYEEALNNLRMADVENTFSAFGSMVPEYFTRRLAIQKQINDEAQIGLELTRRQNELSMRTEAQKGAVKIQAKAAGYGISDEDLADPSKVQQIADKVAVASASGNKFASALHSALLELLKLNSEAAELEKASKTWDGNFTHLKETLDNLDGEEKFNAICESVASAAGLIGNFASQASEMADAMGAGGLGKALGTLGEAMGSVQNVASGFAQGGLVGGIAAAAGEVMKWTTKLFMAGDIKHQKNIERLQEQIDALGKSYEKVGKAADKAYSTDASRLINQQNTLLRQQQALIRQQMAEEEAKKKTDDDKIKEYQERLEEINELLEENAGKAKEAIIGTDIKSAIDEFASLYAEACDDGTDAAQKSMAAVKSIISGALTELLKKNIQPAAQRFYDTLAKAMEDGILTDAELANLDTIKAQMDALAATGEEQYKKIQERYKDLDELREELTDISFDSVRDNFKSLLSDMTSTTEDFTENWTDMVRNALINGLMDSKYDKMLKEWYGKFAEAMDDQTLTDSERDALRQQYDAIVQQGIADRNAINAIVGGGAYSQQASSGSAWNMNQETGDELNGRFTAMVELEATNNVLVSDGNAIAREILVTLRSMSGLSMTVTGNCDNETLLAIKDMMFLSTGYLEDIAKYSKLLASISSDVAEMKSAVKDL